VAGGWRLVLEWCEREILLAGWRSSQQNRVRGDNCAEIMTHENFKIASKSATCRNCPTVKPQCNTS